MSVRWQHFIDHADTKQKPANVTRLSSRRSSAADRQSVKRILLLPLASGDDFEQPNRQALKGVGTEVSNKWYVLEPGRHRGHWPGGATRGPRPCRANSSSCPCMMARAWSSSLQAHNTALVTNGLNVDVYVALSTCMLT